MRLTGKRCNNAKRAKQFALVMQTYFNISEDESNAAIAKIAPVVRYFKSKNIYLTKNGNEIEVDPAGFFQVPSPFRVRSRVPETSRFCTVMLFTVISQLVVSPVSAVLFI